MQAFDTYDDWYAEYRDNWLKHYQETGETNFKIYNRPRNHDPISGKAVDLSQSRLLLISSAGSYLKDSQQPYDAANKLGDYTIREIPSNTPFDALAYAHDHYDHQYVNADPQVLLPLGHLRDLIGEGLIGELAPNFVSYMGYQPDATRTVDETMPEVIRVAKEQQVQAALLVPS